MKLVFEGQSWSDIIMQVNRFSQEHGKMPVDLDNRHPHGNTPAPQTQPAETSDQAETSDATIDDDTIVKALRGHVTRHGKESAINILHSFEVERASELPQEVRPVALEQLNG